MKQPFNVVTLTTCNASPLHRLCQSLDLNVNSNFLSTKSVLELKIYVLFAHLRSPCGHILRTIHAALCFLCHALDFLSRSPVCPVYP